MTRKLFLFTLIVVALLVASCGQQPTAAPAEPAAPAATSAPAEPTATEAPAAPLVLKIANTANITTWDPVASYSRFIHGLDKAEIDIDRKILADLAVMDKNAFAQLADQAKSCLAS